MTDFNLITSLSNISDHVPVQLQIRLKTHETLDQVNQSISDILDQRNNHSRVEKIIIENVNIDIFINVMNIDIDKMKNNADLCDVKTLCSEIETSMQKSAKIATNKIAPNRIAPIIEHPRNDNIKDAFTCDSKNEYNTWKSNT